MLKLLWLFTFFISNSLFAKPSCVDILNPTPPKIILDSKYTYYSFSPNNQFIIFQGTDPNHILSINLATLEQKLLTKPSDNTSLSFDQTGKPFFKKASQDAFSIDHKKIYYTHPKNHKKIFLFNDEELDTNQVFRPSDSVIVKIDRKKNELVIFNALTDSLTRTPLNANDNLKELGFPNILLLGITQSQKLVFINQLNSGSTLIEIDINNPKAKGIIFQENNTMNFELENGELCRKDYKNGVFEKNCYDDYLIVRKTEAIPIDPDLSPISIQNQTVLAKTNDHYVLDSIDYFKNRTRKFCIKTHPMIDLDLKPCENNTINTPRIPLEFLDILGNKYCAGNNDIEKDFPLQKDENPDIYQAKLWLKKFSRPNGFSIADLPTLKSIVENGIDRIYPNEFKDFLYALLGSTNLSPQNQTALFSILLPFYQLNSPFQLRQTCLSAKEKEILTNNILKNSAIPSTDVTKMLFQNPALLKNLGAHIPSDKIEDVVDQFAEQTIDLENESANSYNFRLINRSELYKVSNQSVRKAMGLPYTPLYLSTFLRKYDGTALLTTLSTEAMQMNDSYAYPYFTIFSPVHMTVRELPLLPRDHPFMLQMKSENRTFNINYQFNKIPLRTQIAERMPSVPYDELLKDKELNGLIIAGANLGKKYTDETTREYIDYYISQGFTFSEPETIADSKKYLKEQLTAPHPVDFFIKEAHTDGDSQNLFQIAIKSKKIKASRVVNGITENIEILYPAEYNGNEYISNEDFGNWIKIREKKDLSPLVYINSSCWSYSKTINELISANSPKLIDIPTTTSMEMFTNDPKSPMYAVLHGIRQQQNYSQIREGLSQDVYYQRKSSNVFLFPDENEYESWIRTKLSAVDISVSTTEIINGEEVPYVLPSAH